MKPYIYVIEDEAHLARMKRLAERHGGELRCDICGWEFRVRDVIFSKVRARAHEMKHLYFLRYLHILVKKIMVDPWELIGVTSLIAATVTAFLGIVREVIVEKRKFKRENQKEYVQKQLNLYRKISYILDRPAFNRKRPAPMESIPDEIREFNKELFDNSHLLDHQFIKHWFRLMALMYPYDEIPEDEREANIDEIAIEIGKLRDGLDQIYNDRLLPIYRDFVGETAPLL